MANRRSLPRSASNPPSTAPLGTALWLLIAICSAVGSLISRGKLEWPPTQLLASLATVVGYLALVGPILLRGRGADEIGLGELIWMTGGLVIWIFDAAAVARGDARSLAWATPLGYQPMGLTILAVTLAAWRCRVGSVSWSWTNVTGWSLGLFWVLMAMVTLLPPKVMGLALK